MSKENNVIELKGVVKKCLPNACFEILLENGHTCIGYTAGRLKKNRIRILEGDQILASISTYDLKRARITFRY